MFTSATGEGPCLDAVKTGRPVLVPNLDDGLEQRWPAFGGAMIEEGVRAVFALPVTIARTHIGALDLFRRPSGRLSQAALTGGKWASELAALPLLDLMSDDDVDWVAAGEAEHGWDQLASLERVEVYQATGMVMAALETSPAEALVRLRAYAFSQGRTASDIAWAVVTRRLEPGENGWQSRPTDGGRACS